MALQTPLHDTHVAAGGRMVEFAGFDMPVQYSGVKAEHTAVRTAVGMFDVSHMGEVFFDGPDAAAALGRLVTNDLENLQPGRAQYNVICNEDGGIVDDTVIYRLSANRLMVCVNASNRAKDFAWLAERARGDVSVTDQSDDWAQIAVQGPRWAAVVAPLLEEPSLLDLPAFSLVETTIDGISAIVATTGYTGEAGVEIFCPSGAAAGLWAKLTESGADHGLLPCGLGARDSLRLEAKLCLYGNDIDDSTTPLEAGLGWVVKPAKGEFIGRDALVLQKERGIPRRLVGFEVTGRGIARHDYPILDGETQVGTVTSGTMSPTLGKAIGMGYVPWALRKSGTELSVDVRGRAVSAVIVKGAFYKRRD